LNPRETKLIGAILPGQAPGAKAPDTGMPPTGKVITVTEMTFDRFADGKLVEDYAEADLAGLMQQLGAIAAFE
jgi:hypothetical protein